MRISVKNVSAAMAIWMLQFNYFIGLSTYKDTIIGGILEKSCLILAILAIIAHYVFDQKVTVKKNSILLIFSLLLIASYTALTTSGGTLIKMLLFAMAFKGVGKKEIWKYYYRSTIGAILFISVSACLGIIEKTKFSKSGTYAYGFGLNPNILAISIFLILIIKLYLMERRPRIWWQGIIAAVIINEVTKCRSVVAFLILLSLIMFLNITRNLNTKILAWVDGILPIILSFFSIYIAKEFNINNLGWISVNRFMSARPYLYHLYYINFPISLFGNYFDKTNYGAMDNTYLMLLLRYGVIIYVIYMFIFLRTIVLAQKRQDRLCLYIIAIYFIFFGIEYSPSIMNLDFVLIYFWLEFWEKDAHLQGGKYNDKCYCSSI